MYCIRSPPFQLRDDGPEFSVPPAGYVGVDSASRRMELLRDEGRFRDAQAKRKKALATVRRVEV